MLYFFDIAGWSSQVARRAHNPKVVGSNPAPATKSPKGLAVAANPFFSAGCAGGATGCADKSSNLSTADLFEPSAYFRAIGLK